MLEGFTRIDDFQRWTYVVTLLATITARPAKRVTRRSRPGF